MNIDVRIKRLEDQSEYYQLKLSTYKETIEGKFSKEDLRYLIQQIDNEII
jgi:chaperonin cofactor prefoldin